MDIREKTKDGKTICPMCKIEYIPTLPEKQPGDTRSIQHIYPNAPVFEREQLLTGICSNKCWQKYLGF